LLGLEFIAVMPKSTSPEKITAIEFYGGRCHFVDSSGEIYAASQRLAEETGGHYMDQFTFAERATDWRGNNNIAQSLFEQMAAARHPVARWIVVSAGTGGTAATIGRYLSYQSHSTRLCVCDPEKLRFLRLLHRRPWRYHYRRGIAGRGHRPAALRAVVLAGRH